MNKDHVAAWTFIAVFFIYGIVSDAVIKMTDPEGFEKFVQPYNNYTNPYDAVLTIPLLASIIFVLYRLFKKGSATTAN